MDTVQYATATSGNPMFAYVLIVAYIIFRRL